MIIFMQFNFKKNPYRIEWYGGDIIIVNGKDRPGVDTKKLKTKMRQTRIEPRLTVKQSGTSTIRTRLSLIKVV